MCAVCCQRKRKSCTFAHFSLCPNSPTMLLNYALHSGKPHAGAFEFVSPVETLEYPEQFVGILLFESGAVITDENYVGVCRGVVTHFDDGHFAMSRVLNGVREQVCKDLLHQTGVAGHDRQLP